MSTTRKVAAPAEVVRASRRGPLRWEAWAPGLLNARTAPTEAWARRRVQRDLDLEWRTGRVARAQRHPH